MKYGLRWIGFLLFLSLVLAVGCSPPPPVEPEVKPPPPPPPAGFRLKTHHLSMSTEMEKSYLQADEILIGTYTGSHNNREIGLTYYFTDFSTFDKTTLTWSDPMNVIVSIHPAAVLPELIGRNEFKTLSSLDRRGICWDFADGKRYVYLVEGQKMLMFLELGYDETSNRSYRNLIDAYPVTNACSADRVFQVMLHSIYRKD